MDYFVEGRQGSGKSTMGRKLSELNPDYAVVREGECSLRSFPGVPAGFVKEIENDVEP